MQIEINLKFGRLKFFTTQTSFKTSKCRHCGQDISWIKVPHSKRMPCTISKQGIFTLHTVVCPVLSTRFDNNKRKNKFFNRNKKKL